MILVLSASVSLTRICVSVVHSCVSNRDQLQYFKLICILSTLLAVTIKNAFPRQLVAFETTVRFSRNDTHTHTHTHTGTERDEGCVWVVCGCVLYVVSPEQLMPLLSCVVSTHTNEPKLRRHFSDARLQRLSFKTALDGARRVRGGGRG